MPTAGHGEPAEMMDGYTAFVLLALAGTCAILMWERLG
jgi:hypothetical protein